MRLMRGMVNEANEWPSCWRVVVRLLTDTVERRDVGIG